MSNQIYLELAKKEQLVLDSDRKLVSTEEEFYSLQFGDNYSNGDEYLPSLIFEELEDSLLKDTPEETINYLVKAGFFLNDEYDFVNAIKNKGGLMFFGHYVEIDATKL